MCIRQDESNRVHILREMSEIWRSDVFLWLEAISFECIKCLNYNKYSSWILAIELDPFDWNDSEFETTWTNWFWDQAWHQTRQSWTYWVTPVTQLMAGQLNQTHQTSGGHGQPISLCWSWNTQSSKVFPTFRPQVAHLRTNWTWTSAWVLH